jgi:integrase
MDLGLCAVAATQTRRRTAKPRWCSHERQHNRAVAVAPDRAAQRQGAEGAGLADDPKGPLFRTIGRGTGLLTRTPLPQRNAYAMVGRRAAAAGIATRLGNHSCRATGITAYLKNGGTLEKAAQMANHASTRTTQLYDRRREELSLDEVERIRV